MSEPNAISQNTEVSYYDGEEWRTGRVHAIKKLAKDNREYFVSYLIDTGEDGQITEILTEEGEDNTYVRQPVLIEVHPANVKEISA